MIFRRDAALPWADEGRLGRRIDPQDLAGEARPRVNPHPQAGAGRDGRRVLRARARCVVRRHRGPALRIYERKTAHDAVTCRVDPDKLELRLIEQCPAPDVLDRLALPIVTAMPLDLPIVPGGVEPPLPSAGPYYAKEYQPGRVARLARNPYWNAATLRSRAANVDEIEYRGRIPDEAAAAVSRGEADVATFAAADQLGPDLVRDLMHRYGVNRGRFFVRPRLNRVSVVFNVRRPLFRNNPKLRRAVNFALDRAQLVAAHGPLEGRPTDQLLLPGRPGFRNWKLYPYKADIGAARRLARGVVRRRDVSLYVPTTPWGTTVAAVVRSDLPPLGLRVHVKTVATALFANVLNLERTPWDLAVVAWNPARDDPVAFINFALDGRHIGRPFPGFNLGRFNEPKWNARMRRVARTEQGRDAAFARLDRDLMRIAAPLAPYLVENALTIVSPRVGCLSWLTNAWPNLAGLCVK